MAASTSSGATWTSRSRDVGDEPLESELIIAGRQQTRLEVEPLADVDHAGDDAIGMSFGEEPRADLERHGAAVLPDANHWTP